MKTFVWDVDDVLNDLIKVWFKNKWTAEHPECSLEYSGLIENPPHELLGVSMGEYLASLDEFRLSARYSKLQPVPELKNWFLRNGRFFRHIAVSAVPVNAAYASAEWLLRHFGVWIRSFHFVPSVRRGPKMPMYDKTKTDFLKWFGKADIFIDDNETNIRESENIGIKGILFPRPWNSSKLTIKETLEMVND